MVDAIFEMKVMISKKCAFLLEKGHVNIQLKHFSNFITQNQLSAPGYRKRRDLKGCKYLGKIDNLELSQIKP